MRISKSVVKTLSKRCHGDPGGLENPVFSGPPGVLTAIPTRQEISVNILILLSMHQLHIFIYLYFFSFTPFQSFSVSQQYHRDTVVYRLELSMFNKNYNTKTSLSQVFIDIDRKKRSKKAYMRQTN